MKDVPHGNQMKNLNYDGAKYSAVALTYGDLLVLCRRIDFCPINNTPVPFGGYWSVFCGAIEENESAADAGVREVLEESGLNIEKNKLNFLGKIKDLALFTYELEEMPNITLNFEHTEYGFFKITQCHRSPDPVDLDLIKAIQYNHFINQ